MCCTKIYSQRFIYNLFFPLTLLHAFSKPEIKEEHSTSIHLLFFLLSQHLNFNIFFFNFNIFYACYGAPLGSHEGHDTGLCIFFIIRCLAQFPLNRVLENMNSTTTVMVVSLEDRKRNILQLQSYPYGIVQLKIKQYKHKNLEQSHMANSLRLCIFFPTYYYLIVSMFARLQFSTSIFI